MMLLIALVFTLNLYLRMRSILVRLDESFLLEVGGLTCDGSPLRDCSDELWNSYDTFEMYKSCLRGNHHYVQGELIKAESLTVENRILHYLMNRGELSVRKFERCLTLLFFIKIISFWDIPLSCHYHLGIDISHVETMVVYPGEHLTGDNLLHKIGIYKCVMWKYQEDHNTTANIGFVSSDEEKDLGEQNPGKQSIECAPFQATIYSLSAFQKTPNDV
ncbi:hypothetical protein Lal_00049357 [Lupinus albus]|nr:hypothetical protein Lal_00049357 [Lupinus albus]